MYDNHVRTIPIGNDDCLKPTQQNTFHHIKVHNYHH